ncbi:hypothetical protein, partial [Streptomyces griseoluteus]
VVDLGGAGGRVKLVVRGVGLGEAEVVGDGGVVDRDAPSQSRNFLVEPLERRDVRSRERPAPME